MIRARSIRTIRHVLLVALIVAEEAAQIAQETLDGTRLKQARDLYALYSARVELFLEALNDLPPASDECSRIADAAPETQS